MRCLSHTLLVMLAALIGTLCLPNPVAAAADFALCQLATARAEHLSGVPDQLLDAISRVETGRYDLGQGAIRAWPWTINVQGQGHFYASKGEAVEAARQFKAQGIQSMDVGCTQINLMYHPDAFASLEDAFDPARNANYAAHFLTELFRQVGSWPHAAAAYHSQTPELGTDYQRKVLEAWSDPIAGPAAARSGRAAPPGMGDFHRQLAALSSSGPGLASSPAVASGFSSATASPMGRPIGRNGVNAPLGGFGRIVRTAGPAAAGTNRNLSAYRAMPVALVMTAPHLTRY